MSLRPDEQVALLNEIMRKRIKPALPDGMGATLLLFPMAPEPVETRSLVSYISTADRKSMRETMRGLLAKWDREAAERGEL